MHGLFWNTLNVEGDAPKNGLSMKFQSMQNIKLSEENFYSTDFDDEVSLIRTTEKPLIAIEVCKL